MGSKLFKARSDSMSLLARSTTKSLSVTVYETYNVCSSILKGKCKTVAGFENFSVLGKIQSKENP